MMLPIYQGGFLGAKTVDGKVCIGYKYLRKFIPKYIKPMSNINNITCGCETCISAMLLQSDINKWSLSKLAKLDHLYINSASTRIYKDLRSISLNTRIKYFQIFHIYI